MKTAGYVVLGLLVIGFAWNLKDIQRYIRITRM